MGASELFSTTLWVLLLLWKKEQAFLLNLFSMMLYEPPWLNLHDWTSLLLFLSMFSTLLLFNVTVLLESENSLSFPVLSTSFLHLPMLMECREEIWENHRIALFEGPSHPLKDLRDWQGSCVISVEIYFPFDQAKLYFYVPSSFSFLTIYFLQL